MKGTRAHAKLEAQRARVKALWSRNRDRYQEAKGRQQDAKELIDSTLQAVDAGMPLPAEVDLFGAPTVAEETLDAAFQRLTKRARREMRVEMAPAMLMVGARAVARVAQLIASKDDMTAAAGIKLWCDLGNKLLPPIPLGDGADASELQRAMLQAWRLGYAQPAPEDLDEQERQQAEESQE